MMERFFHSMFALVAFIVIGSMITGVELTYEILLINGALVTGYVLISLLPKHISKLNWETGEILISAGIAMGLIIMLDLISVINVEDGPTLVLYAIILAVFLIPKLARFILKKYFKKKGENDENQTNE